MPGVTPVAAHMIDALNRGTRVTAAWAGWGSGKSIGMLQAGFVMAHTRRGLNKETLKPEPLSILICAESEPKLEQNLIKESHKLWSGIRGARFIGDPKHRRWVFENGNTITFKSFKVYPRGPCSIEGETHAIIMSDETQELNPTWVKISRARARQLNEDVVTGRRYTGQVLWAGYPQANDGWLRAAKALHQKGRSVEFLHYRSASNPFLPEDYEEERRADCATEEEWLAVCQINEDGMTMPALDSYYGQQMKAALYPEGNLISIPQVDRSIETIISCDPGRYTWTVLFWQHIDVQGIYHPVLVDSWAPVGMSISDQAAIREVRSRGYNIRRCIIDPFAGAQKGRQADGWSTIDLLRRPTSGATDGLGDGLGIEVVTPAGPRTVVEDGISRTRARLHSATGERCILIREELWNTPSSDRDVRFSLQNFAPSKKDGKPDKRPGSASDTASHLCDALRYFTADQLWWGMPEMNPSASPPLPPPPSIPRRHAAGPGTGRGQSWRRGH